VTRFPDHLLDAIAYLYQDEHDAISGEKSGGTAFILGVPFSSSDKVHRYLVANSHLIENGFETARFMNVDGTAECLDLRDSWIKHPSGDDLAVTRIDESSFSELRNTIIMRDMLASEERLKEWHIGIGDDVMFIGRFSGHDGKDINVPSLRFGNISMMPSLINQGGKRNFNQLSFLIEGRSMAGYSGSPVFFYNEKMFSSRIIDFRFGTMLLGVDWGHIDYFGEVAEIYDTVTNSKVSHLKARFNSGMMGVVPAWKLDELLNEPGVVAEREDIERNTPLNRASLD